MKISTLIFLFLAGTFICTNAAGQANASINILTQNTGVVVEGEKVFLEVTINNTGPSSTIGIYKIKTQISVPSTIASIPSTGHTLPNGWIITSNDGSTIRLSNATDSIAVNDSRTVLIAIQGDNAGGPSTISGQLSFSNGNPPGTAPGTLPGDNTADNSSTSTILVTGPLPLILHDFTAAAFNCKPELNWVTENETNSERFDIERHDLNNSEWLTIGVVQASGKSTATNKYKFIDNNISAVKESVLYRLKIIDKDGQHKYSAIIPVIMNCKSSIVKVYPNPVENGRLYISLGDVSGYNEATLLSPGGQMIVKKRINSGTNLLNVPKMANGLYFLTVTGTNAIKKNFKILIKNK